eukprot:SAG31_NODE_1616_length_7734_cov_3.954813_3_plen_33_part_00
MTVSNHVNTAMVINVQILQSIYMVPIYEERHP